MLISVQQKTLVIITLVQHEFREKFIYFKIRTDPRFPVYHIKLLLYFFVSLCYNCSLKKQNEGLSPLPIILLEMYDH